MKFIASSTELLKHLIATSKIRSSGNKEKAALKLDDIIKVRVKDNKHFEQDNFFDSIAIFIDNVDIYVGVSEWFQKTFSSSTRTLLRELQRFSSASIALFNYFRLSHFASFTLLFGLCCSRPSYIFDAITGSSSSRIFSL